MNPEDTTPSSDPLFGNAPTDLLREAAGTGGQPPTDPRFWEPPAPEELQARLDGYLIEAFLARGGMGAVYRGIQTSLERPVAIKILPPSLGGHDHSFLLRFKQEARAMAQLNHPGIVKVYDFGEMSDGTLYFIMEFIDGTDVARMVASQGRLSSAHAMAITAHVCDALQYAHEHGIVHRDIKPANIMVGHDGRVKVADFGLAKSIHGGHTSLTVTGHVMGTLHFVAPEALILGSSIDHRADIYAMGVMLYQMLTGRLPQGIFEMPSLLVKGLDPRYDAIIAAAMQENRAERYQTIHEMRRALDAIVTRPISRVEALPATVTDAPFSLRQPSPPKPATVVNKPSTAGTWLLAALVLLSIGSITWIKLSPSSTATKKTVATDGNAPATTPPASPDTRPPVAAPRATSRTTNSSAYVPYRELMSRHQADARQAIAEAEKLLGGISAGDSRDHALSQLAISHALRGEHVAADSAASKIKSFSRLMQTWQSMMDADVRMGRYDIALRIALRTSNDPVAARRSLTKLLKAHLTSAMQHGITEMIAALDALPAGRASTLIVLAEALLYREKDSPAANKALTAAYAMADELPAGADREQLMRQLAAAFPRAQRLDLALAAAGKIQVDPKGAPQGHAATTLAEMGDIDAATNIIKDLPSAWARGWSYANVAKALQRQGRDQQAIQIADRIPYGDQRNKCLVQMARISGDVVKARQALENIKRDKHNPGEAEQLYLESAPVVTATIASVEGIEAAKKWLQSSSFDHATQYHCWLAIATHWVPQYLVFPGDYSTMHPTVLQRLVESELAAIPTKNTPANPPSPSATNGAIRTFTDTKGRQLRARLLRLQNDDVTLKREDGQVFTLKASTLCEADIAFLKSKGLVMPQAPSMTAAKQPRDDASMPPSLFKFRSPAAKGQHVVFVIDLSASMSATDGGASRLDALKTVLLNSLDRIPPGTAYQILFFSDFAWPHNTISTSKMQTFEKYRWSITPDTFKNARIPTFTYLQASSPTLEDSRKVIREVENIGGTNWGAGLLMALRATPRPDVIFFVTDGIRADELGWIDIVTKENQGRTIIHTSVVMETDAAIEMDKLASKNGGTFSIIQKDSQVIEGKTFLAR